MSPALADEFFRLAHHEITGRPLLHPGVAGIGLASALLGELLHLRRISIHRGRIALWDASPPRDPLAHAVLARLGAGQAPGEDDDQPGTSVTAWLHLLSQTAYHDVANRLVLAGQVRRVAGRWPTRSVRYVPSDLLTAARPWVRLNARLSRQTPLEPTDVFLICLVSATGLESFVFRDLPEAGRAHAQRVAGTAPGPVPELISHTAAAVGDAVLTYRI